MKSVKKRFPFDIGTTSYIIHKKKNNLLENIKFLKDKFDKIQLLLFGRDYLDDLINDKNIDALIAYKEESGIDYIVHLPIDLDLMNESKEKFKNSLGVIDYIFNKTYKLNINEFILHIDRSDNFSYKEIILNDESTNNYDFILSAIKERFKENYSKILIENTGYDLTFFKDTIIKHNFNICMDIGHLFINNFDFDFFINTFKERINEIHLHGFLKNIDHQSLKKIKEEILLKIFEYLKSYKNSLIIEVFNKKDLTESIKILLKYHIGFNP